MPTGYYFVFFPYFSCWALLVWRRQRSGLGVPCVGGSAAKLSGVLGEYFIFSGGLLWIWCTRYEIDARGIFRRKECYCEFLCIWNLMIGGSSLWWESCTPHGCSTHPVSVATLENGQRLGGRTESCLTIKQTLGTALRSAVYGGSGVMGERRRLE